VQVAANCTGGMTKSAAFFFDPRSRRLAALYADPQLKKARSSPRLLRALASGGTDSALRVATLLVICRAPLVVIRPDITHEVNAETEGLFRQHQIDYLLTQDLDQMVLQIGEALLEVKAAGGSTNLTKLLPIRVFTPFHFP
jgi:hypothetical protein